MEYPCSVRKNNKTLSASMSAHTTYQACKTGEDSE
jgi:hypothetical protein